MWIECLNYNISLDDAMKIIDDALANGFEFKVENYTLYFREIEY